MPEIATSRNRRHAIETSELQAIYNTAVTSAEDTSIDPNKIKRRTPNFFIDFFFSPFGIGLSSTVQTLTLQNPSLGDPYGRNL